MPTVRTQGYAIVAAGCCLLAGACSAHVQGPCLRSNWTLDFNRRAACVPNGFETPAVVAPESQPLPVEQSMEPPQPTASVQPTVQACRRCGGLLCKHCHHTAHATVIQPPRVNEVQPAAAMFHPVPTRPVFGPRLDGRAAGMAIE